MQTTTCQWTVATGWVWPATVAAPQLVLYFGATSRLEGEFTPVRELLARFPHAVVCGCSTAGEILGSRVFDDSVVAALIEFKSTSVRAVAESTPRDADCRAAAVRAARRLTAPDLRHVLMLSDGLSVNGTELVAGFRDALAPNVALTGGLAGDGSRFGTTLVGLGSDVRREQVVAVGLYGAGVCLSYSSCGGWEGFGPRRRITRSRGNQLLELDGQPALALYKRYLGDRAAGLPATGLLFPLELAQDVSGTEGLVRTILAVDEGSQSLTFAGDMPEGWYVRLMKATADQLVDGAAAAGRIAAQKLETAGSMLAIMVSCVGRRLVLGQRIEEELEAAMRSLPPAAEAIGFYSYGEACPAAGSGLSELHNQTMTLTVITERD